MPIYGSPYYGTRQKALTGLGYGPYYGMTFPGGGALPPEERRALPAEISEKYGAVGGPAITETTGELGPEVEYGPGFPATMVEDPNAMKTVGYMYGLNKAPPGIQTIQSPAYKGVAAVAKAGIGYATKSSLVGFMAGPVLKMIEQLAIAVFPGLASPGRSTDPGYTTDPAMQRSRDEYQEMQYEGWEPGVPEGTVTVGEPTMDPDQGFGYGAGLAEDIDSENGAEEGTSTGW